MANFVQTYNEAGHKTVRLSDDELHRAACQAIWESGRIVFESLPNLVALLIKHKVWKNYGHSNFADYALDDSTNGLGINTNQRLWILRCSMDVHGAHIKEWADVLDKVEKVVRVQAAESGDKIRHYDGNSLETLGKAWTEQSTQEKITYLPSRNKNLDGQLILLRKKNRDLYRQVISGKISMTDARSSAGLKTGNESNLARAQSAFRKMTAKERKDFKDWLRTKEARDLPTK